MFRVENLPKKQLTCPHCKHTFKVPAVNPLKANLEVLACEACGEPVVLELYDELLTWFSKRPAAPGRVSLEEALAACHCGGRARPNAPPRCPDCKKALELPVLDKRSSLPLIGEVRLSPVAWDSRHEALRDELARAALYSVDPAGARFSEACLALPALALLDPERAFSLLRQALSANPEALEEDNYYPIDEGHTLFTLAVSLLTAALNGCGRQVIPYVASQFAGCDPRWIRFLLDAMQESDQLNRMGTTSWMDGGKARAAVEAKLRSGQA